MRRSSVIEEQCLCAERKSPFLDSSFNCLDKDFKRDARLVFGTGVRNFMTSFGIRNEGGRLLFPRREQARSDEAVARLIFDHATVLVEAEDQRRQSNKNWSQV